MKYKLVFIDDSMKGELDDIPFVKAISKFLTDAEIEIFDNPQKGLEFVLDNLNNKIIVFVDCKFEGYGLQGINILKKIRAQTSLLYIVMMSANAINQMYSADVIEMINEDYICFFDRNNGTVSDACDLIKRICNLWETRFDCILEDWLVSHPEDNYKEAFTLASTNKTYTWADILVELRLQTNIGKSFEQTLNKYYIYQITRSKK